MPTLNQIRDQVRELIRVKEFPLSTQRALWRGMIEFGEASDVYLKTGLVGYWNKKLHKPVSDETVAKLKALGVIIPSREIVLAKDAYLEELIDVVFFVVNATHIECEGADLDKVFRDKLAYNLTRPKQYGISDQIKSEVAKKKAFTKFKAKAMDAREMKSIAFGESAQSSDYAHSSGYSRRDQ